MILLAIENNNYVYVYDEKRKEILKRNGHLHNYTCNTVAIASENNQDIDIYSSNGEKICSYPHDLIDTSNIQGIVL